MKISLKRQYPVPDNGAKTVKTHLYKQGLATFASCLISLSTGLTYGITAVMLPQLREDKSIQYDASYDSWIVSSTSLAMIVGSLVCGPILDNLGRKATHIIMGIPFIIGWIFIACANSTYLIIVGRVMTGLSSGGNKAVTAVYIGEITDPKIRTAALYMSAIIAHVGILFSHIIGHYLVWNISSIIYMVPSTLSFITFLFLKESPLWLIAKGRIEEGTETFRWFRGTGESSELELKLVLQRQTEKSKISVRETLNAVCNMSFMKPMFYLVVLMLNLQFSGFTVLIFYSQDIIEQAFSNKVDAFLLVVVMDCIRSIAAVSICLLGNLVPKRNAYLFSTFGVSGFVFGLVACFATKTEIAWLPILCLVIYIGLSSALASIAWSFAPELLPNNARGLGSGFMSAFAFFLQFIILKITPDLMNTYGEIILFGFFGVSTAATGLVLVFILPETNGKTLQSIEDSYNEKKIVETPL